jgi:glycine dehydrogenase
MPQKDEDGAKIGSFSRRHIGPGQAEVDGMMRELDVATLEEFVERVVPRQIRATRPLELEEPLSEPDLLELLATKASKNRIARNLLGMGYSDCYTPPVIQRNIMENPAWYTQYTPYQSEISQGRLEALLNFQTVVLDLTGMELANASLLDEATAAAEAMSMLLAVSKVTEDPRFLVASDCHPQTIEVVRVRAHARGWAVIVQDPETFELTPSTFGVLLQYPSTSGEIRDLRRICAAAQSNDVFVVVAADLLSLCMLTPPGEFGADVVVGSTQRLGMPMGFGGPHAAFFATRADFRRHVPGRIIGVSEDASGKRALRMALQTREQHIKRERATSNICTAQVLPAVVASMFAVFHGPEGLKAIAWRVHQLTRALATNLSSQGWRIGHDQFFDCLKICCSPGEARAVLARAKEGGYNLRQLNSDEVCIALDETCSEADVETLASTLGESHGDSSGPAGDFAWHELHRRQSRFLTNPVFNSYQSETEMLRYMRRLEERDLSLVASMIPLGSCTMKLNASAEMFAITWPQFARLHPFAPADQSRGYAEIIEELSHMLREITGLPGISLQPNAGSLGELAGLLAIAAYHASKDQSRRRICLIPASAHGTNPASAVMAGYEVVVVRCDEQGNIDRDDLSEKAEANAEVLAALMVTYPSTHGVFEEGINQICETVHRWGGQVYMDGANLNALVGVSRPADMGIDACHVNLHKTFCIPHGGGGPGMGPIAVAQHLEPFLPSHPIVPTGGSQSIGPVAAAPWGSALILIISWAYIKMMGGPGLQRATVIAILNANYVAHRLHPHFPVLYRGKNGLIAHEAIIDLRHFKASAGITVEDVAKRLMDYGYHAPTVSFPVAGTLMIEPTESESKRELDRFCSAMISIREEIAELESGAADLENNVLVNAPHTMEAVVSSEWEKPYSREKAALPASWLKERKFWPSVARVDNAMGDRQLVCSCPPVESYAEEEEALS